MGWLKEPLPPCTHKGRPNIDVYKNYMVGGIWKCDDCEETFIIDQEETEGGTQWESWPSMKLVWKIYTPPTPEYYHSYLSR